MVNKLSKSAINKFDKANHQNKTIAYKQLNNLIKTGKKYNHFPSWIERQSNYYTKETNSPTNKYKRFKRGALIFVDFGINIGNELSGNHWAIVLDKNDSIKKGTLTVVPVSSKNKQHSVMLDSFINEEPKNFIKDYAHKMSTSIFYALHYIRLNDINFFENEIDAKTKEMYYGLFPTLSKTYTPELGTLSISTKVLVNLSKAQLKLEKLVKHYSKFDKTSYAKCNCITTISKERIIYMNDLDPCGKFKISSQSLSEIDNYILNLFIKTD